VVNQLQLLAKLLSLEPTAVPSLAAGSQCLAEHSPVVELSLTAKPPYSAELLRTTEPSLVVCLEEPLLAAGTPPLAELSLAPLSPSVIYSAIPRQNPWQTLFSYQLSMSEIPKISVLTAMSYSHRYESAYLSRPLVIVGFHAIVVIFV